MIVPGGGISLDGTGWVSCKPGYFLPVPVLAELFRRLFLDMLVQGLSHRRPGPLQSDDPVGRRVYSPVPDVRAAEASC
jgi:Putative transposase